MLRVALTIKIALVCTLALTMLSIEGSAQSISIGKPAFMSSTYLT